MPKVRIKYSPKRAKNGASLEPLTNDLALFHGPSHENNGIPYKGVEVEGQEVLYKSLDNSEIIFGNMQVPGLGKKFKDVAQTLAKKEQKVDKLLDKGTSLVNNYSPDNPWDELKFNAGRVMMTGSLMKKQELKGNKEHLATLQQAMLDMASEMGADPQALSKGKIRKAKNGLKLYENGGEEPKKKQSMAVRMNNPGNIKFGEFARKLGAVQGDPATDGGYFAKFPDVATGMKALRNLLKTKNYNNMEVDAALKRWTNGSGYNVNYDSLKGKKIKDLSSAEFDALVSTITYGEDGKYYKDVPAEKGKTPVEPFTPPTINKNFKPGPGQKYNPRTVKGDDTPLDFTPLKDYTLPSNAKGLDLLQIAPELVAFGQNRTEPVWMQQYSPQLFQNTSVSFQDRLNENQTSFNSLERIVGNNPTALATLAGQKYAADNSVMGEEFRTNQQIEQDITNKNISLLNDAQLKNLQLADQQYVRQSQAKSNIKALNNTILNSVTSKIKQNELEQQTLRMYENLYNFRADENGRMTYMGPDGSEFLNWSGLGNSTPSNQSTTERRDSNGNIISTTTRTASPLSAEKLMLQNQKLKQENYLPLLPDSPFVKKGNKKLYPWEMNNGGSIQKLFKKR